MGVHSYLDEHIASTVKTADRRRSQPLTQYHNTHVLSECGVSFWAGRGDKSPVVNPGAAALIVGWISGPCSEWGYCLTSGVGQFV